jgi:hypothetical protein
MRGTLTLVALAALALAGCGGGAYDWRAVAGGGAGLPQVAMAPTFETVTPPGRGAWRGLAVRTFTGSPDGWTEVAGARCVVRGAPFFEAALVTPSRLVLPDLGPDAPTLRATCETPAAMGTDAVAPVFAWPAEGRPGALSRMWWGGGWWFGLQKTGPLSYPDLAVALVPRTAGATR